ncbi:MAG TPA: hypothetical protein ENK50_05285 [Sedimenticola sp.]|nr:hypothetical protein [Sedimenticola sp.]
MTDADFPPLPGSECILRSLGTDRRTAHRLAQMGVLPGCRLRIVRASPFGETLEVAVDQSEQFALRRSDLARLDCQPVALPLTAPSLQPGHDYRIHGLLGGRRFLERCAAQGLAAGTRVRIERASPHRLRLTIPGRTQPLELGRGEAERIVVELGTGETAA